MFSLSLFIQFKLSYIFDVQKVLLVSAGTVSSALGTLKNLKSRELAGPVDTGEQSDSL